MSLFSFAAVLVVMLWKKYLESPTRMTISAPLSTLEVPFPAVTVCHPQSVLDYKAEEFVDKMYVFPRKF